MSIFKHALMSRHTWLALLILCLMGIGLTACGKKPAHVDPPPDVVDDEFPRIYPDPKGE